MHDVIGVLFGTDAIRLEMFTIGVRYTVSMVSKEDSVTVNFRAYFGIGNKKQYQKFTQVLRAVWDSVVIRLLDDMNNTISHGGYITIGKCVISDQGISYKENLISRKDLSYQVNYNRLTLNSKSNASLWTNLYFTETYNVHILRYYLDSKFNADVYKN